MPPSYDLPTASLHYLPLESNLFATVVGHHLVYQQSNQEASNYTVSLVIKKEYGWYCIFFVFLLFLLKINGDDGEVH